MKTFHNVVNAIVCCAKEGKARALIVLDIEWVQFVLQTREILQNYRFKQGKKEQILSKVSMIKKSFIVLFTWDVMRKSMFKRPVYTRIRRQDLLVK